jgi:hypothetical protein
MRTPSRRAARRLRTAVYGVVIAAVTWLGYEAGGTVTATTLALQAAALGYLAEIAAAIRGE